MLYLYQMCQWLESMTDVELYILTELHAKMVESLVDLTFTLSKDETEIA